MKHLILAAGLLGYAAASAAAEDPRAAAEVARAQADAARTQAQAARERLLAAREEMQQAARELTDAYAQMGKDSPRAWAYQYMTDSKRALLGISIGGSAERNGDDLGVKVTSVTPGSGADKAGLQSGDLLLSANGTELFAKAGAEVDPKDKLMQVMAALQPGAEVKLEYERGGKHRSATVITQAPEQWAATHLHGADFVWSDDEDGDILMPVPPVAPLPPMPPAAAFAPREPAAPIAPLPPLPPALLPGLQLARIDSDLAGYFKTDHGVLVVKAQSGGALGLRSGDVIQRIDGEGVSGPVAVIEKLAVTEAGKPIEFALVRQGKEVTVKGKAPSR